MGNAPVEHGAAASPAEASGAVENPEGPIMVGPVRELEQLLADCHDVRNLTLGNRLQAVGQYRQLSDPERRSLSMCPSISILKTQPGRIC